MATYAPLDPEAGWGGSKPDAAFEFAEKTVRLGFIRKVFGLLSLQLAVTVAVTTLFVLSAPTKNYVFANPWTFWTAFGVSFGLIILMGVSESVRRSYPMNLIVLSAFTLAESVLVGTIAATYNPATVLLAAGVTGGVVLGLFAFSLQTKVDLTASSGLLFSIFTAFFFASIIQMFVHAKALHMVLVVGGAVLFSVYLVFDVQMIMGGHKYAISPDEYVFATLNLYLDVINLFLYILQILSNGNRD